MAKLGKSTKFKSMTKEEFDQIKLFQNAGATRRMVMDIKGRSSTVVGRIYNCETFEVH